MQRSTTTLAAVLLSSAWHAAPAAEGQKITWLSTTAYCVPKETATEGEGYFAIVEGKNGRLYIGTHANAVNSWLVEFDPKAAKMNIVVDAHKAAGIDVRGFAAQSKIHTRNNVGASGKVYFGTKQGYPAKDEKRTDYPGGYPMVYDPATGTTKVYPIAVPHQGVISVTPDESRDLAYISTCSDERPVESSHFLVLDLKTGKYRDLIDTRHMYAFIVVDYLGRAYHPIQGGDIARFTPPDKGGLEGGKLDRLKQTIDGKPPAADSHLADANTHPINWDISPDGKTLYALPMSTNELYAYDLTEGGDVLRGRSLGPLIPGAKGFDCRGMCCGPSGAVWASVTEQKHNIHFHHLVSWRPGDKQPRDHGAIAVANPDFTEFTDKAGKQLPFHGGLYKMPDGTTTTRYVTMGVCEARDGNVYILAMHPYMVLQVKKEELK
jgi:hypothetical protein